MICALCTCRGMGMGVHLLLVGSSWQWIRGRVPMDTANPEEQTLRYRHPVAWYGVAFGVLAGGVLAAAGVGKVTQGQEVLVVCGAGVAACCYAFAGAFASMPGYSVRDG